MKKVPTEPTQNTGAALEPRRKKFNFARVFWLSFLVISLGYAWYSFYAPSNKIAWVKDHATAQQQSIQSGKPVVMFFTGKWCSPCRIMERTVWADSEVESAVNARFTAVMIDIDDPAAAPVVKRYGVGVTPTTIITDPHGAVLQQVTGGIGRKEFLDVLAKPTTTAESF